MLLITNAQLEQLARSTEQAFYRKVTTNITTKLPREIWKDGESLIAEVARFSLFFQRYGIRAEADIEEAIIGSLLNGHTARSLTSDPKILDILSYPNRPPADKIFHLFSYFDSNQ